MGKATESEPIAATVAALGVENGKTEVQAVAISTRIAPRRPMLAVRSSIVQIAIRIIVEASAEKAEGCDL